MSVVKGCLMWIGLACLALVTSCVVGVSGSKRMADPTHFSETVTETPEKTRRMVRTYLETATYERGDAIGLRERMARAEVRDYSDGSIHLTLGGGARPLVEIVATVTPDADGARVEIDSDAAPLGRELIDPVWPAALHRQIKEQMHLALAAIDDGRVIERDFRLSRIVADARGEERS